MAGLFLCLGWHGTCDPYLSNDAGWRRHKKGKTMKTSHSHFAKKMIGRAAALSACLVLGTTSASSAASLGDRTEGLQENASSPRITFANCRMESTPPYEEGAALECGDGQVIVAVYANTVRCCSLTLN